MRVVRGRVEGSKLNCRMGDSGEKKEWEFKIKKGRGREEKSREERWVVDEGREGRGRKRGR
jgi:hypothetical protein